MIYIVEDDASIRELEQYALQTNQYTVRGFEDGASFWAAVRETITRTFWAPIWSSCPAGS